MPIPRSAATAEIGVRVSQNVNNLDRSLVKCCPSLLQTRCSSLPAYVIEESRVRGQHAQNLVCADILFLPRLFLLRQRDFSEHSILPDPSRPVLASVWKAAISSQSKKVMLSPLHDSPRFRPIQTIKRPPPNYQPFQQLCLRRCVHQRGREVVPKIS